MNCLDENQHYVSRVLLERFKVFGEPLRCFQVASGLWMDKSLDKACSAPGYNQLRSGLGLDNTLEDAFSRSESRLPRTLNILQETRLGSELQLPREVYDNLCWYCAFLKLSSLAAKALAIVNFVYQLNLEIEIGQRRLLDQLQIPEGEILGWKQELQHGRKIVIEPAEMLQLVYRNQFLRTYGEEFRLFELCRWRVAECSRDMPVSDIGIVPISLQDAKAQIYILPIGPRLLLIGRLFHDVARNTAHLPLERIRLDDNENEYFFDAICASAVIEVVCSAYSPDVAAGRSRAYSKGLRFLSVPEPERLRTSGLGEPSPRLCFRSVSPSEFVRYVHSFAKPPDFDRKAISAPM